MDEELEGGARATRREPAGGHTVKDAREQLDSVSLCLKSPQKSKEVNIRTNVIMPQELSKIK